MRRTRGSRLPTSSRTRPTPSPQETCSTRSLLATCRSSCPATRPRRRSGDSPRRPSSPPSSAAPVRAPSRIGCSTAWRCSGSGGSISAERAYSGGRARSRRNDPEARVAAAVGLFDKAQPARAFSAARAAHAKVPEGRDGALPSRAAPALVGPGEGGAPSASARPHRRARIAARRRGEAVSRRVRALPASDLGRAIFLTQGVSDGYRHSCGSSIDDSSVWQRGRF